ncbi:Pimeloyl-ACP methyl ester carboxylesterase [Pedobacter steynii]|uniref:Pimeloyl-ACP methyl ester carboxylesterase n=1 Tax=Pedobacter steynii TaxID=430522 RepID=A0A1G9X6Y6_9SPHI|nr:alpha/beta hydrolase [Pedobacter steynii]NQX40493.1 alpha/beta hydrolase [Pedobacter steynii]SDM92093.1 Pimeloyl-ACP methyl ester carboxylesterase [Pedobacter steynii]
MKKLRKIVEDIKNLSGGEPDQLQALLWQLICYSPKMPLRLHQQKLLDEAEITSLKVHDQYFSQSDLKINCFKWGNGPVKILLSHGWGSKGSDFSEIISMLRANKDFQIWSFDAPGNGSSEGEISNLFLYAESIKQLFIHAGIPQVMIGHSLGGMANALALQQSKAYPQLLISIAPMVNLKDNFIASMEAVKTSGEARERFFADFEKLFEQKTEHFVLNKIYDFSDQLKHLLIYDSNDLISPSSYIEAFLKENPETIASAYEETSHSKILTDPRVLNEMDRFIVKNIH